ncbi:MAG: redoxin domain-containing protein [Candidatus Hodarchaeales archaeon]|jgi:thiol-disulfide isomerase/thioredoxin
MVKNNKGRLFLIVLLQLMIFFNTSSVIGKPNDTDVSSQLPVDTNAPDFSLTDILTNESFSLTDFQGKVVILDLFATWCGPCVEAIPNIREIFLSYSANDLMIVSIEVSEEDVQLLQDFIQDHEMEWLVTLDNNSIVNNNYGSGYIPTLYVIDQNQIIAYSEIGFNFGEVLNALDQLGLEPTRPISPGGSLDNIPFLGIIPTIFIAGIGFMVIFIIGAVIYGRYQQKKQAEAYQARYGVIQQQRSQPSYDQERAASKVCPNCNGSLMSKAKFCLYCGSDLNR